MRPHAQPVFVFFAFANDRAKGIRYLRNLPEEQRRVRDAMAEAEQAGLCHLVERPNATVDDVFTVFQHSRYRNRVAIFHYGGHAGGAEIILETPTGEAAVAHAGPLARFLGEQRGLDLVFLNGCSTRGQVMGLLDAGVSAVIATSQAIADGAATEFSTRFYNGLASGATLRTAFNEAQEAVRTRCGEDTRGAYRTLVPEVEKEERWPWALYVAAGAEDFVKKWSLPLVAHEPLYGLPEPPTTDLPPSPFKHLHFFTRADADIFFGRGREIRDLYDAVTAPDGAPIVLLFGAAGVGKSSLLDAGLRPRLEVSYEVVYLRRSGELGLAGSMANILGGDTADFGTAWRQREVIGKRALVLLLDQVEEAWTRPLTEGQEARELVELVEALRQIFAGQDSRPRGRLLLCFRKEWLAEIQDLLNAGRLPFHRMLVKHLDRDGIVEAIAGPATSERLRRRYQLTVEPELPGIVADDLLEDPDAVIAPALQILLSKIWNYEKTVHPDEPQFTVKIYQSLRRRGLLLDDFVDEQLEELREWRPELVESGLVLDLLAHHTTAVGTAETRQVAEVVKRYGNRRIPDLVELIQQCKDRYVLTSAARIQSGELKVDLDQGTTRLGHDTLAPIVRRRFEESDLPGQRAVRVLVQRVVDWADGLQGAPLDEADLALVERGEGGMRIRTADEERLVKASRQALEARMQQRRKQRRAAVAAVGTIAALGLAAVGMLIRAENERRKALEAEERSQDRARVAIAGNLLDNEDPILGNLVLLEIGKPDETPAAGVALHNGFAVREHARLVGHTESIWTTSFSLDGTRVVTASYDGTARVWNAATGHVIANLDGHASAVHDASFSPDGTRVVTASWDGTARVWNALTGQTITKLQAHTASLQSLQALQRVVWDVSFSSDGTRVLTASADQTARIWNVATGEAIAILQGHTESVDIASFSSDSTRVVTASADKTARVWSATTGEIIAILQGHLSPVAHASFSPDGTRVVTASWDGTARIWNATEGEVIASLEGHTAAVLYASFSPDGTRLVTASSDRGARIWNVTTGEATANLQGHSEALNTASFSPDGTRVVTASVDGTARIWNVTTGETIANLQGHTGAVLDASFSSDGTRVVTASDDQTTRIWNAAMSESIASLEGQTATVLDASFSPDGSRVMTADWNGTARIWNATTGASTATLKGHTDLIREALFSSDGSRILTASSDETVRIWNATTGEEVSSFEIPTNMGWDVSFGPDSPQVVTISRDLPDQTVQIWNVITGQALISLQGHPGGVLDASFGPDGTQILTAHYDDTGWIWNATTGVTTTTLRGFTDSCRDASFSPDGSRVVSGCSERTLRIWNVTTGEPIATLQGNTDIVWAASFSPDSTRIVTVCDDQTARIWNATTGEAIATLEGHTRGITAASFNQDSTRVVTRCHEGGSRVVAICLYKTPWIWNATTGEAIATLQGHTDTVRAASFSPDGTRILTASEDRTVKIWAASGELHQALIRARNGSCLDASFRQNTLGEAPTEAQRKEDACNACIPEFFERLGDAPRSDWKRNLEAWRAFRRCFLGLAGS